MKYRKKYKQHKQKSRRTSKQKSTEKTKTTTKNKTKANLYTRKGKLCCFTLSLCYSLNNIKNSVSYCLYLYSNLSQYNLISAIAKG
jgi:uncharacterized ion transporter superfamily protein YfcC